MAAKKESEKAVERTYNVPLRKEYQKVPNWKRTNKAVVALRQFLARHMKTEDVRLAKDVNEKLWQHGIKNPPHHVKVTVTKDEKGIARAELFGVEKKEKAPQKKAGAKTAKKETEAPEQKAEAASVTD
ncbi:60S ribosomal protein L31 [Candidatus Woesearchaeota archaeon]|nr:60S ribosomal protein L31 [Candidatus Woesearchaeota archaeon]